MSMSLNDTPRAMRLHIGLFGRRNSGKSSLINALTGQHVATVSDVPGTTTDPVYKSMEIHGIGPVVFIDTAGFDDSGSLGALRVERTRDAAKETDIALVPSNVASVLYNKTKGGVRVIDLNTLGVLSVVTGDSSVEQFEDLAGHTVYLSGQGASPEYTLNYLLDQAGIKDQVSIEFKSEHSECAAAIQAEPTAVAILPEPFTTATLAKDSSLLAPVSLTDVWDRYAGGSGSQFVMGVTIARSEFVDDHPEAISDFLSRHAQSVDTVNGDPAAAAPLVVKAGIVASEAIAEKAIPKCNIVCTTGEDMRSALSGYLQVLYDADASSVGGALPGDDFYYVA